MEPPILYGWILNTSLISPTYVGPPIYLSQGMYSSVSVLLSLVSLSKTSRKPRMAITDSGPLTSMPMMWGEPQEVWVGGYFR